jgi:hypothetical protein
VATASPVKSPAAAVTGHAGTGRFAIAKIPSVAQVMAARNGLSFGEKNRWP